MPVKLFFKANDLRIISGLLLFKSEELHIMSCAELSLTSEVLN
jgi:hypothetical protein